MSGLVCRHQRRNRSSRRVQCGCGLRRAQQNLIRWSLAARISRAVRTIGGIARPARQVSGQESENAFRSCYGDVNDSEFFVFGGWQVEEVDVPLAAASLTLEDKQYRVERLTLRAVPRLEGEAVLRWPSSPWQK